MKFRPYSLPGRLKIKALIALCLLVVGVVVLNRYNYTSETTKGPDMGAEQRGEVQMAASLINAKNINSEEPLLDEKTIEFGNNTDINIINPTNVLDTVKGYAAAEYFKNTKTVSQIVNASKLVERLRPKGESEFAEMIGELKNIERVAVQALDGGKGQISGTIRNMSSGKFTSETHTINAFFNDLSQVPVNVNVLVVGGYDVHIRYGRDGCVSMFVVKNQSAGTEHSFEFYNSGSIRSFIYSRLNLEKTGFERSLDFMISEEGELVRDDADP
jgi:hypothetical protein